MKPVPAGEVRREVWIDAPPERVFTYFTDPRMWERWQAASAWTDPTVGGELRIDVAGRRTAIGRYVEIIPFRTVSFTWGWEAYDALPPMSSLVTVELSPERGGTRLLLVHGLLPESELEDMALGWAHYLDRLRAVHTDGSVGPDPWLLVDPAT